MSPGVDGVWVTVAVTAITLGVVVVVGSTMVVEGGIETEETLVVVGVVTSGVEVEASVTVTVVEKDVARLVEVVVMMVVITESVELESKERLVAA